VEEKTRKTGIDAIGTVPWGTHLCHFYDTKQDLIDILVPYFKTGLENNESCIWVTAEPLSKKEAEEVMGKAVPNFARYLERGQIEIVLHTALYLTDGAFNLQRVLNAWLDKLNKALAEGYDGMGVTGNMAWLEEEDWTSFTQYEEEINSVIGKYHMLAICTYPLAKCGASELIDVMRNHQDAIIRHAGDWVVLKPKKSQVMTLRAAPRRQVTSLQEWFIRSGFEGLHDHEVIELLLSLVLPYRKCKRLARDCIEHFKSLRRFLVASHQELAGVGITPSGLFCIKLLHELPGEILRQRIIDKPVYKSAQEVFDYLSYTMRDLKKEVFKVIYLNNRNQIIDTEDLFEGTLESTPIRPREIIESSIKHKAAALIFVHNHPTGDPTPSRSDKRLTRDLVFAGSIMQIKVLDHIIIGENTYFSFADDRLIEKYEDDFLNIRIRRMLQASQYLSLS